MKTYFAGTQKPSIVGVWTAPGAPDTTPKGGARSALPFGVVSRIPGAAQTPQIDDFWVLEEYVFLIILIRFSMSWNRYPGLIFVNQAGAVAHVPEPNFCRKPSKNREDIETT